MDSELLVECANQIAHARKGNAHPFGDCLIAAIRHQQMRQLDLSRGKHLFSLFTREAVSEFLQRMAGEHTFAVSVVASQVISNVPATIILAPFTEGNMLQILFIAFAVGITISLLHEYKEVLILANLYLIY